ncbi:hypothetical protein [Streptomyces sp. WAC 05379]|uniref:hypothetical protein n=1 Tax=Streptomyces sp. WAC 05379 TaxID=2203207 RepID=UPI0021ADE523|nr:hypothetical protein [Streptomyces sp. WAC 05379]
MRHDFQEEEAVPRLGSEYDTPHEGVDADGPDPRVAGLLQFFQVQSGVPVFLELVEHFMDPLLDGLLQPGELQQEVLVDPQRRHASPARASDQFS